MDALANISLGCSGRGVRHTAPLDVASMFSMVRDAGVYDHFDRLPQPGEEAEYLRASEKYGIPIRTGLGMYRIGANMDTLESNLHIAKAAGGEFHNVLLFAHDSAGTRISDEQVVTAYLDAFNSGIRTGVGVGFEVHINMWSEDFRRVERVAAAVRERGIPFNFVLDHSHVLLKIDNPEELDASGLREEVESGAFPIDPYETGNVIDRWLSMNMTPWLQVRPASPNGPKNRWAQREGGGGWGRACQYPFVRPAAGEWHSDWHAYRLQPCKEVVRKALCSHFSNPDSVLRYITTDMIDMPDYGENARYSLFEQNVAIAEWIRNEAKILSAQVKAGCSAFP
ncbi:MAG: xylose isomerase [Pseudomonadota bacterium]